MAKTENLRRLDKIDKKEAKKIRSKGGKARAKKIKEKKELKKRLEMMFEIIGSKKVKDKELTKKEVDEIGADVCMFMETLTDKSLKPETRLDAINKAWDRMHGKPLQRTKETGNKSVVNVTVSKSAVAKRKKKLLETNE